jgi:hypothetical protein
MKREARDKEKRASFEGAVRPGWESRRPGSATWGLAFLDQFTASGEVLIAYMKSPAKKQAGARQLRCEQGQPNTVQ